VARRKADPPAQRGNKKSPGAGSSKVPAGASPRPAGGGGRRETVAGSVRTGGPATQALGGIGRAPALVVPLQLGAITIDATQLMIERDGLCSWFTPVEWRLLCVFLRNPGAVLTREELAEQAWGVTDEEGYGAVNVYISRVRRKLDPTPGRSNGRGAPELIQTVRHQGYRLVLDEAADQVGRRSADRPVNARSARRA
jgi:DNA-binding winged helix-turn-helix (wHTH) protein